MDKHSRDISSKAFEAALRDLGTTRLRLDQVVMAYQRAFPADSMRPDMRERLHSAIAELCQSGVISIPDGESIECQNTTLPATIDLSASAQFLPRDAGVLN